MGLRVRRQGRLPCVITVGAFFDEAFRIANFRQDPETVAILHAGVQSPANVDGQTVSSGVMNAPRFQRVGSIGFQPRKITTDSRSHSPLSCGAQCPLGGVAVKHRRGKRFAETSRRRVSLRLAIFSVQRGRCYWLHRIQCGRLCLAPSARGGGPWDRYTSRQPCRRDTPWKRRRTTAKSFTAKCEVPWADPPGGRLGMSEIAAGRVGLRPVD